MTRLIVVFLLASLKPDKASDNQNKVKTECDLFEEQMEMENETDNDELSMPASDIENDTDWSRGAPSPQSVDSAGSDAEFQPDTNKTEQEPTPQKRWNLRRNRKVNFAQSDSDSDSKQNSEKMEFNEKDFEAVPSNPKIKPGRGWPRVGECKLTVPCPKCKKMFIDKRSVATHLFFVHDTRLTYSCAVCSQKFIKWRDLRNHKRAMHRKMKGPKGWSKKPRKCLACSQVFSTIAQLTTHQREAGHKFQKAMGRPRKTVTCATCDQSFPTATAMRQHCRQEHRSRSNGDKSKCTICDLVFPTIKEMREHRSKEHSVKRGRAPQERKCSKCDKTFPSNKKLLEHCSIEHRVRAPVRHGEAKCIRCGEIFPGTKAMLEHRKTHRKTSGGRPPAGETKCSKCDLVFPTGKKMIEHRRTEHPKIGRPKGHKCKRCEVTFSTRPELAKHRRQVHKVVESKHECPICYRNVVGKERLKMHLDAHENKTIRCVELWYCEVCSQHFYKPESLQNHMAKAHNNLYTCTVCKADLESGKLLRDHLTTHEKPEKFFHCLTCFRGFSTQQYYDIHHKIAHKDKRRSHCDYDMCNEIFESVDQLNEHLQGHAEAAREKGDTEWNEVFTCSTCGKGFIKHYNFVIHKLTHTPHNEGRTGYDCPVSECGQTVRYLQTLLSHYNRVHGMKIMPCKCYNCGKEFSSTEWYRIHMRDCEGSQKEKPVFCEICAEEFPNKKALILHKVDSHQFTRRWRQNRQYEKCPEPNCEEILTARQLNIHLVKAHGKGEQFPCDQCGKLFIDWGQVKYHIKITHEPLKHKCKVCGRAFQKPSMVRAHVLKAHVENRPKAYTCHLCGLSYFTRNGLRFHNWSQHAKQSELPYKCPHCGKGYGRKTLFTLHKKACAKLHGVEEGDDEGGAREPDKRGNLKQRRKDEEEESEMSEKSTTEDEEEEEDTKPEDISNQVSSNPLQTELKSQQQMAVDIPYPHQLPQSTPSSTMLSYQDWLNATSAAEGGTSN